MMRLQGRSIGKIRRRRNRYKSDLGTNERRRAMVTRPSSYLHYTGIPSCGYSSSSNSSHVELEGEGASVEHGESEARSVHSGQLHL